MTDDEPAGEALVRALEGRYPDRLVTVFRPRVAWADGGHDPIDLVAALPVDDPVPHWYYAGSGLADRGFELTLRLVRDPAESGPPTWPLEVLQNIGRYVRDSGNRLHSRDWMPLYTRMTWEVPTDLTALVFFADPDLPTVAVGDREIQLFQVIGVTDDELDALREWDVTKGLDRWRPHMPHWVIDPGRPSMFADASVAEAMATGARTEGSGSRALYANRVHWEIDEGMARVSVLPEDVPLLLRSFRGRLPFGNELLVADAGYGVLFQAADTTGFEEHPDHGDWMRAFVTPEAVEEILAALRPLPCTIRPGTFPGFELRITDDVP